ncbi:MAG: hypothetical protein LBE55_04675, partial [Clostridiales bacterium]|nr:hypothetical protein [Clostridiales bacterium]
NDYIISLGDSRSEIEALFGQPINVDRGEYEFQGGLFVYFEDEMAVEIVGTNGVEAGRFGILGFRVGMTLDEIGQHFERDDDISDLFTSFRSREYHAFRLPYDENGNAVNEWGRHVAVGAFVSWEEQEDGSIVVLVTVNTQN